MSHDLVDYADFVREFTWTKPRHGGDIEVAAPIFGLSVTCVEKRLFHARAMGIDVQWTGAS